MLPGTMIPLGAASGSGSSPTLAYLQHSFSGTNRSTYSFSANLGTPSATRNIIVAGAGYETSGVPTINSITVAGVTATIFDQIYDTDSTYYYAVGIGIAAVPTGTSGTISIAWNRTINAGAYAAWEVTDLNNASSAYDVTTSTNTTLDINVPINGIIVAAQAVRNDSTITWAGVTERFDNGSTPNFSGGDHTATATESPRSVSFSTTGSVTPGIAVSLI